MIHRIQRLAVAAASGAIVLFPASAIAADNSIGLRLQAVVEPFCKIQSQAADSALVLEDGTVDLGMVREVCNTRGGYNINVQLLNVVSGTLHHGDDSQDLDTEGRTRIDWHEARARTSGWRLTKAAVRETDAPIYLRVSISPL